MKQMWLLMLTLTGGRDVFLIEVSAQLTAVLLPSKWEEDYG